MATKTTVPFILSQNIRPEDHMIIATQSHEAFIPDVQTRLKTFNLPPSPVDTSYISDWLSAPQAHVIKAISPTTGEILGSVCWVQRGYHPRPPQPEQTRGRLTSGSSEQKTKVQQLEDLTDAHFAQFMSDIMPEGTKCWFIASLIVAPKFQGMGVGRALMGWGTERAEEDGVFAWVHASEGSWKSYEACGFEVVRTLRLGLDDFAEGEAIGMGPGEEGKWGEYWFRYMVYKPQRAVGLVER